MRPLVICICIRFKIIGLAAEISLHEYVSTFYYVSEEPLMLPSKNKRYKHANHPKANLLAILGRIYYFTSILTH